MSYATIEKAVLDVIQKLDRFRANNSARGDERILARGPQVACILRYGGHRVNRSLSLNQWSVDWTVNVDLWFKSRGEISFYNEDIAEVVDEVLKQIMGFPSLNKAVGVLHGSVLPGDASDPVRWQGEVRNYWVVSFPVQVTEERDFVSQE